MQLEGGRCFGSENTRGGYRFFQATLRDQDCGLQLDYKHPRTGDERSVTYGFIGKFISPHPTSA